MSLGARHIGDLQLGIYAAPSYLQSAGLPSHPQDLALPEHHIVGFSWAHAGKSSPYAMHRNGERVKVHGRYMVAVDDGNAYLAAGLAGLGALWLPAYMAKDHVACGELVALFEDWRLDTVPLYVAYPPSRHVSAKLRVFVDWVVQAVKGATKG